MPRVENMSPTQPLNVLIVSAGILGIGGEIPLARRSTTNTRLGTIRDFIEVTISEIAHGR
jgi:hypothetical protein